MLPKEGLYSLNDFHRFRDTVFAADFSAQLGGLVAHPWIRKGGLDGGGQAFAAELLEGDWFGANS